MASLTYKEPNFRQIAKKENTFNYSVASLGDIYSPYLTSKEQRQYDILSEEEMLQRGIATGKPSYSYKKYNKPNYPHDPNLKNVSINQVDLGKGLSKNIYLNQGKAPGQLKGHKIISQRPTSAISTKKMKYNQDLDPAQRNRIIDVNYLHLTKLPESKKFSHVDKAIINPVQSTFSVKNIVDDNIKNHEKMMKPIVLYPDPVRIFNEQPDKILPGSLRRSQEEIQEYEKDRAKTNMMVIGQSSANKSRTYRDNHVTFNKAKDNKFRRKATSTKAARNTLRESEEFVDALDNYFLSTDFKIPPKHNINVILKEYAERLENSLNKYENEISGKKKMKTDTTQYLYQDAFKNKKKSRLGQKVIKPRAPKVYPEIDYDFRKKIQERLSTLQINLRQIFDNISILKKNKTRGNVKKINEQIKKARELTDYVRHLADDVNNGEYEFNNSMNRPKSSSPKKKFTDINKDINLNNSFNNTSFNSLNVLPQNNVSYYNTMNNSIQNNTVKNNINNNLNYSSQPTNINSFQNNVVSNNMNNNISYNTLNNTLNNNMNNSSNNNLNNNMNNSNNGYPNQNNSFNNNTNTGVTTQNNNPPTTTQLTQNQQVENALEYSTTSISSNINPMNSFTTNVNNISTVQQTNQNNNNINIINNNNPQNNIQNQNTIIYNNNFPQPQVHPQPQYNNNTMVSRTNIYIQSQNFNPIIEDPNEEMNNNASTINNNISSINQSQRINQNISYNNAYNNNSQNYLNNSLPNNQNSTSQNINPKSQNINKNSNYFLQSANTFKDINPKSTSNINKKSKTIKKSGSKPKSSFKTKPNNNSMTKSKMITVSLAEPEYFRKKPNSSQTFRGTTSISLINPKSSDVLTQSHVINDIDQTINHVPMQVEEMKVNTKNYIEDERYSSFNVEFPVKYYYELTKEHEPPKNKEWFIRPHHTETFVESKNAIPDDIMNTKYLSYYAPANREKKKTRQDVLEELIMETRARIGELQEDMFKKSNLNKEGEKLYSKLEDLREEAKKSFIPGYREAKEAKQKSIYEMLKDPNAGASYSEMFDQNEDIKQTNFAINSVGTVLSELRDKERNLINIKRKEEYERIRPPVDRWYELKSDAFLNEIVRNKMVLNSGPEYFEKIEELQNEELY